MGSSHAVLACLKEVSSLPAALAHLIMGYRDDREIYSTSSAKLADGRVVTWKLAGWGRDSSSGQAQLHGLDTIYSTDRAFAAKLSDGRVVTWGDADGAAEAEAATSPPPQPFVPLVAGYLSGTVGLLAGHPLDSVRVWMQSRPPPPLTPSLSPPLSQSCPASMPCLVSSAPPALPRSNLLRPDLARSASRLNALRASLSASIATATFAAAAGTVSGASSSSQLSLRDLYRGIGGPLVTVGAVQALSFGLYEKARDGFGRGGGGDGSAPLGDVALAAAASGAAVSVITSPLLSVKIRQQLSGGSFRKAAAEIASSPSVLRGAYAGFPAHLAIEAGGRAVFFVLYEGLKGELLGRRQPERGAGAQDDEEEEPPSLPLSQRMTAAALAGITAATLTLPLDAVRTRVHVMAGRTSCSSRAGAGFGAASAARELWRSGGGRAFLRGYGAAVFRAGPVASISMPAYELALGFLHGVL